MPRSCQLARAQRARRVGQALISGAGQGRVARSTITIPTIHSRTTSLYDAIEGRVRTWFQVMSAMSRAAPISSLRAVGTRGGTIPLGRVGSAMFGGAGGSAVVVANSLDRVLSEDKEPFTLPETAHA